MILLNEIVEPVMALKDQFFDLQGLSVYSSVGIETLRDHIRSGDLLAFKVKGKVLVRKSEFDAFVEAWHGRTGRLHRIFLGVVIGIVIVLAILGLIEL